MTRSSSVWPRRVAGLYRSRDGMIFGVCRGLADYAELNVTVLRIILVIAGLLTWFIPFVLLYIAAAIFMKLEPVLAPESEEDWEFYNSYATSRSLALARLKRQFDRLERRTRRMEHLVTSREYDWDQRLRKGA